MPVDVEHQLRQLGAALTRASASISPEEAVARHRNRNIEPDDTVLVIPDSGRRQSRDTYLRLAAIAAAAAVTVAGLAAITSRVRHDSRGSIPGEQAPAATAPAGAVVLDPLPDGWTLELAASDPWRPPGDIVTVYVAKPGAGNAARAVFIQTFDAELAEPSVIGNVSEVDVAGLTGHLHDSAYGRALSFERDGVWFMLASQWYDDSTLLAMAAATTRTADHGTVIAPDVLPSELVDRRIGHLFDPWWIDAAAVGRVSPFANWTGGDQSLWCVSVPDPDGVTPLVASGNALAAATVWGDEASVFTLELNRPYRTVAWLADGRTYMLGGRNDLTTDELVALANDLRRATADEWQATLDRFGPDLDTKSPATSQPAVGFPTNGPPGT